MIDVTSHWEIFHWLKRLSYKKVIILVLYCVEQLQLQGEDDIKHKQECIEVIEQWIDDPKFSYIKYEKMAKLGKAVWISNILYYAIRSVLIVGQDEWNAAWVVWYTLNKCNITHYMDALTKTLPKTPFTDPFEIIVYLQDQELYPILDGNRLNLWSKDYEYQVTGSIEQIANTVGIRNLLNA